MGDAHKAVESMASVLLGPGAANVKAEASLAEAVGRSVREGSSELPLQVHASVFVSEKGVTLGLKLNRRMLGQRSTDRMGNEEDLKGWLLEVLG